MILLSSILGVAPFYVSHFAISLLFDEDTDDDVLAHKLRFNGAIVISQCIGRPWRNK